MKVIVLFFSSTLFFSAFSSYKDPEINCSKWVSPCGRLICAPTLQNNGIRVLTYNPTEPVQKELAQIVLESGMSNVRNFAWSPDGACIAFICSDVSGAPNLGIANFPNIPETVIPIIESYKGKISYIKTMMRCLLKMSSLVKLDISLPKILVWHGKSISVANEFGDFQNFRVEYCRYTIRDNIEPIFYGHPYYKIKN